MNRFEEYVSHVIILILMVIAAPANVLERSPARISMKCIEFYFILKIKTQLGSALRSQLQISAKLKVVLSDLQEELRGK